MKKILILALAAAALIACGGRHDKKAKETAGTTTTTQAAAKESQVRSETVTGGYTAQRALNDDEKALFNRVTAKIDSVKYTPESVATQVVSGTNYRFVCKAVSTSGQPQTYKAAVIVYQPLPNQGEARITKIERL